MAEWSTTDTSGDLEIECYSATYADARSGAGTKTLNAHSNYFQAGQRKDGSLYYCWQGFLNFDTSGIPDDAYITEARLQLTLNGDASINAEFDVEVRLFDWGASLTTADWVPGATFDTLPKMWRHATDRGDYYQSQMFSFDRSPEEHINKIGNTRFVVATSRFAAGTAPTGFEYMSYRKSASYAATLYVQYAQGGAATLYPHTDGYIKSAHATYATCRAGASLDASNIGTGSYLLVGHNGTNEICEGFCGWSLHGLQGMTILDAAITMNARLDHSDSNDFDVELRERDWGEDWPASADWVAGNDLDGLSLLCHKNTAGMSTATDYVMTNDNLVARCQAAADAGGALRAVVCSSRTADDGISEPGATTWLDMYNNIAAQRATCLRLYLEYVAILWGTCSVVINADAAHTHDNDVTLTLQASATLEGASVTIRKMRFSEDGANWGSWVDYATSYAFQLSPQTTYPSQTKTVYAQFRVTEEGADYDSSAVSDSIFLQVEWTGSLAINGGAPWTASRDVSLRFRGRSSASSLPNGRASTYRVRDTTSSWSSPAAYVEGAGGYMTVPFTIPGASPHTLEVEFTDDDGNSYAYSATIDVLPAGEEVGNAPPPQDITNWRLQIGTTIDVIDALAEPPRFNHGEHGPGSLQATLPVENPMRRYANEFVSGSPVKLYDGTLLLWDGELKPTVPSSSDESVLVIDAAGPLDLAKQDGTFITTFVDANPANWHISAKASKAFGCDTEGGPSIRHTKGRGVEGMSGASIWYWVNDGKKNVAIDHLEFSADSSIDVGGSGWFARVQVSTSPWGTWTTVKTWNNETLSGTAIRVPATAGQSFAEAGYDNVYAVRVQQYSDVDLTAAQSVNTRWIDLCDPLVFVNVEDEPRVDEVLSWFATEMGSTTQETEPVGNPLSSLAFLEQASRAADMETVADMYSGEAEWGWRPGGLFICRPKPTSPPDRMRWYVIDTSRCNWGVVADEARRVDYVCVSYLSTKVGSMPAGTPQILYRPSTPTDPHARVEPLDMSETGPMSAAQAQDAGDQWLAWNNATSYVGPVSGFGGALRTVDGLWVAASHARNGDWLQPLDLFGVGPQYMTAVEVNGIDDVTLHIGGSEREFRYVPRPVKKAKRRPKKRKRNIGGIGVSEG